jgi:Flp pilus assembly protein TadG
LARFRSLAGSRGSTILEFSLVAPIVVFLLFGTFEFGRFFFVRLTLQHAVREAARFAVTGNTMEDPDTGQPLSRAESIRRVVLDKAASLDLDVENITIDPEDGGGPSEVVRVRGDFEYQFIVPGVADMFPDGAFDFSVSTAMKNEPFR